MTSTPLFPTPGEDTKACSKQINKHVLTKSMQTNDQLNAASALDSAQLDISFRNK